MTLRERVFWLRDSITGGRVRRELQDIEFLMNDDDGGEYRTELLKAHLNFVGSRVPFYSQQNGSTRLSDYPVVNKEIIRSEKTSMLAIGMHAPEAHVASTSGSTGTPFSVLHDARKRRRIAAEAIFWERKAGYNLGIPLYHLKVWSDRNRIGRLDQLMRNVIPIEVATLGEKDLVELVESWRQQRAGSSVISYGSTLEALARALSNGPTRNDILGSKPPKIRSMIGQSEPLSEEARATLGTLLNCSVVSRYGLEELGIVGQQTTQGDNAFRVNLASIVVEILQEHCDEPAEPGELGRIVVTDTINRVQPLIRYDTGDLGAFATRNGIPDSNRFARIEGRRLDQVFDSDDRPLSTMFMYKIWWRYPAIAQYQFIQLDKATYQLRLKAAEGSVPVDEIRADLRQYLGSNASVEIVFTGESLTLSSGKRKSVVNRYLPPSPGGIE